MVESGFLLRSRPGNRSEGSNPSASALIIKEPNGLFYNYILSGRMRRILPVFLISMRI